MKLSEERRNEIAWKLFMLESERSASLGGGSSFVNLKDAKAIGIGYEEISHFNLSIAEAHVEKLEK